MPCLCASVLQNGRSSGQDEWQTHAAADDAAAAAARAAARQREAAARPVSILWPVKCRVEAASLSFRYVSPSPPCSAVRTACFDMEQTSVTSVVQMAHSL
jgi:hypothetical protein